MKWLYLEFGGIVLTRMNESGDFIEEYICEMVLNFTFVRVLYADNKPAP